MKKTLLKTLGAIALAAVLVFGATTIARPSVAQAVTGSSNSSLEETHIQLLLQIIELLKEQLAALKSSMNQNADDSGMDDSDDSDDDDSDDVGLSELEATIYTNETVVKVELDGDKSLFTTSADTRGEIIDEVLERHNSLTEGEVDDALTVETEDRASRDDDKDWADEDDSDDDDDDDDDDDN